MSEGYVKRLLNAADTLNVLREMPIRCNDLLKNRLTATSRTSVGGQVQNYEHVAADDRVTYFDLRVDNIPSLHLNLVTEDQQVSTQFRSGIIFKTAKELRPCFYLPYRARGTTRMKLSPPPTYNGDEIRFFATATIDGCSVYVEGPAATPKVTHANAQNISPAPTVGGETDLQKQQRIQNKIANMDQRLGIIKKGATTVIERGDYIEDFAPGRTLVKQQFANAKGIPIGQVTDYQPFGAVVGVKQGTDWAFFLQKCGYFSYRPAPTANERSEYYVLSAQEFWPNNTGGFRVF